MIKYFEARGHREITAFVPQSKNKGGEAKVRSILAPYLLNFCPGVAAPGDCRAAGLHSQPVSILLQPVPLDRPLVSQLVGGRTVTPYDDRYILDLAVKKGGVVVSRDNYRDLVKVDS